MPRPITAICGQKCSTPMRSRLSRRPATFSIRRPQRACTITFTRPGARAIRPNSTPRFAAGCRRPKRCSGAGDSLTRRPPARRRVDLHTAGHRRGVVCAPHHLAVEAGRAVLAEGGNAVEAMIAMAATIAVTYPHMNGIGGDGFWLVRERSGKIRALMAAGAAGSLARPELYRNAGHATIPTRGPLAALTVPGAIGGWMLALELAKALGGKLPLGLLLADAIKHAAQGFAVSRSQAADTAATVTELKNVPGFAETFLIDGKPPAQGAFLKQPALAATLDQLAQAGLDDFYHGDLGRGIAAAFDRVGSPVTRTDLEHCRASVAEPLSVALQVGTLYNTPLPTP